MPRLLRAPREGRRHGDSYTSNQNNNKREGGYREVSLLEGSPWPIIPAVPRLPRPASAPPPGAVRRPGIDPVLGKASFLTL